MGSIDLNQSLRKKLLLLILGCFSLASPAQVSPYHYVQIIPGVDAHHTMISDAVKDQSGMIWVVAGGVLYRYDGVNVIPFSKLYSETLPFDEVSNLLADPWGRLWINSRNGLAVFDTNTWSLIGKEHGIGELVGKSVIAFYRGDNVLYVADGEGAVWQVGEYTAKQRFRFDTHVVHERRPLGKILIADADNLWLAFGNQLYRYGLDGGDTKVTAFPAGLFDEFEDLLPIVGGALIRVYSQGYYVFDGDNFRRWLGNDFKGNDFTTWNHWSFTSGDKVIIVHGSQYLEYSRDTTLRLRHAGTNGMAENILYKRLNAWQYGQQEWLLATDQGLYSVFRSRIPFNFMGARSARGMVKQHGTYYFGGYGYLNTWSPNRVFGPYTEAPENNYYAFLPLSTDTTVIAMEGEFLNYLINGRIVKAPLHLSDNERGRFNGMAYCLARQSADTLLVGTFNGIWKYALSSGRASPLLCPQSGFFSEGMRVLSLAVLETGISYTTTEGFFVWKAAGKCRKIYPADHTKLNIYTHSYEGDSVYLGTKGRGLVVLDASSNTGRSLRMEDGLASNTIYSMKWIGNKLFLGTHNGISIYRGRQFFNYYHADGLPFEEFNHQAIFYDETSDWLFMGGTGGYTYFHPEQLTTAGDNFDIQPVLSRIHMGLKTNRYVEEYAGLQQLDTLNLSPDVVWLSMDFARPNAYRQVYRMQFKIEPFMDDYQEMPAFSQINLTGLSAGYYYLSVRTTALNSDMPEIIRTWVIHKKPIFTETLTFFTLLCLTIAGVLTFFLYERSRRTKNEYKLRGKISRDLHDEVGGLLTGISMQADLLKLKMGGEEQAVMAVGNHSRKATQMMDDIIWAVDTRNNDQDSTVDRMKYVAMALLDPLDITISFDFEHGERKIAQSLRQNLYLIFKEAIHNICKHSNATAVRIGLRFTSRTIELYVCDNGKDSKKRFGEGRSGNGLRNMQLRADQINADLWCGFTEDGYMVKLTAPYHRMRLFNRIRI
ncbi:sensor histidine kinase [Parapedobacter pyrenivorans]|uniref:sensor histidine kinase n=1 Tax=Parapedobacter pyrenivorans TaxID=1305674 RepID=UPI00333EC2F0